MAARRPPSSADAQGPSKRARVGTEEEPARKGTVLRVEMRNFMTYSHVVVEPGRRLKCVAGRGEVARARARAGGREGRAADGSHTHNAPASS